MNNRVEEIIAEESELSSEGRKASIAIGNFDGEMPHVVEADRLYLCVPTKDCVQFWATLIACFLVSGVCLVLMIVRGTGDDLFYLWEALFSFSFGVLVPSPNYSSAFKKPGKKVTT